jgi:hypothetical protein
VVGHDGIGGAERHEELAAALGKGAEIGVLGVEIRREPGGVGVDVSAEVDVLQFLVLAEDPVEKIQVPVRGFDGTAKRDAIEEAFAGYRMTWSMNSFLNAAACSSVSVESFFRASAMTASMSCAVQRGSETNLPAAIGISREAMNSFAAAMTLESCDFVKGHFFKI